jgi:hypothetical protein
LPEVCEALEHDAVAWRWRLRGRSYRLACVHGDFHPWNLLFREGTDFSVLDRSRGEWGEPADDVTALGINYLLFELRKAAMEGRHGVAEPHAGLFRTFFATYLEASRDGELLDERSAADVVVSATPVDLAALLRLDKPVVRARYGYADTREPGLGALVEAFVAVRRLPWDRDRCPSIR